jgi:hypothetical protein
MLLIAALIIPQAAMASSASSNAAQSEYGLENAGGGGANSIV